jgi:hypothetical protein
VAGVLHGRAGKEPAPARGATTTWAERTGKASEVIREVDTELDRRQATMGGQLAADPPQWALEAWGVPPAGPGRLRDDWMQRATVVQGYRELAGITNPAVAIGPPPSRQAGMTEAFAASVRALELADNAAILKAMGRGELAAPVRAYARAEALAPPDIRQQINLADRERKRSLDEIKAARQAGNEAQARAAEDLARRMDAHRARLQVADAARLEWEEANADKAEAARQARAELETRGPASLEEHTPDATAQVREVQADDPAAAMEHDAQAKAETRAWPEARAEMAADIDPEALTVMAEADADIATAGRSEFDDNLARAQAGAEQLAEQRARVQAERNQAAINEPASQAEAEAQAELDAANPEADDISLEI